MRSFLLAAVFITALAVCRFDQFSRAKQTPSRAVHASFFNQPALDPPAEEDEEYHWDTIAVRHADAVVLAIAMGGEVAPTKPHPKNVFPLNAPPTPLATLIPDGIQALIAVPATNALMVRGTREDINGLRKVIEPFDKPQPRYRITLSTGLQTVSATTLERETAHIKDNSGNRLLAADLVPRLTASGDIVVEVSGKASASGREWEFAATTRLKPGYRTRIAEFGAPQGRTGVYLRAEILPEEPTASPID
jgi:hypothetical protein